MIRTKIQSDPIRSDPAPNLNPPPHTQTPTGGAGPQGGAEHQQVPLRPRGRDRGAQGPPGTFLMKSVICLLGVVPLLPPPQHPAETIHTEVMAALALLSPHLTPRTPPKPQIQSSTGGQGRRQVGRRGGPHPLPQLQAHLPPPRRLRGRQQGAHDRPGLTRPGACALPLVFVWGWR